MEPLIFPSISGSHLNVCVLPFFSPKVVLFLLSQKRRKGLNLICFSWHLRDFVRHLRSILIPQSYFWKLGVEYGHFSCVFFHLTQEYPLKFESQIYNLHQVPLKKFAFPVTIDKCLTLVTCYPWQVTMYFYSFAVFNLWYCEFHSSVSLFCYFPKSGGLKKKILGL